MESRYRLSRLIREAGLTVRRGMRLAAIEHTKEGEKGYRAAMRKLVRMIAGVMRIVPTVEDLNRLGVEARALSVLARGEAINEVTGILKAEEAVHRAKFIASVRKTIGVDLQRVVTETGIGPQFDVIVKRNVSLITNLSDDAANRVEQAVSRAVLNGSSASRLSEELRDQIGIVGRRADLIARDQIASAVSDLNQLRQTEAGIVRYEWSTSLDERVRPEHEALHGKVFRWDRPGPDSGLHPGQPVNCRCVARAIIDND